LTICVLASGSKGNSIYIEEGHTRLLIDAGLSGREISRRLREIQVDPAALSALIVSHEHSDHVRGAGVLARQLGLTVFGTARTLEALAGSFRGDEDLRTFRNDESFRVDGLRVRAFSTSHDAVDPVGFRIRGRHAAVAVATDLGFASHLVRHQFRGADLAILEANHDERMLMEGPYPWELKQRVRSRSGHLSNREAGELLAELAQNGLRRGILAHLSEQNNTPDLALRTVQEMVVEGGLSDFPLTAAQQDRAGEKVELEAES